MTNILLTIRAQIFPFSKELNPGQFCTIHPSEEPIVPQQVLRCFQRARAFLSLSHGSPFFPCYIGAPGDIALLPGWL